MDSIALSGVIGGVVLSVLGFLFKRELAQLDAKLSTFTKRLDTIDTTLSEHDKKISINAERDGSDYKMIKAEIATIKKDMDKDISNITALFDTKFQAMQSTLERILSKLDEQGKQ